MDINSAAAINAGQVQSQVQTAVMSKVMQVVKGHQQNIASLVEAAAESARAIQGAEPGKGGVIDVYA